MDAPRYSDTLTDAYNAAGDHDHHLSVRAAEKKVKAAAVAAYEALGLDLAAAGHDYPTTLWLIRQVKLVEDANVEAAFRRIQAAEFDADAAKLEAKGGPRRAEKAERMREYARINRWMADKAEGKEVGQLAPHPQARQDVQAADATAYMMAANGATDEEIAAELDPPVAATGRGSVVCDNTRTWMAVRQTPAFAVALDIARQERRSQTRLDVARAAIQGDDRDSEAADAFIATLRTARNDNNVLWGAARLLAAMVDNDDELGALQVLRGELDRQDAGKAEDPYDRWKRAQTSP